MLAVTLDALDHSFKAWSAGLGLQGEQLLRLILAGIAGGLVGLEREVRGRTAGFRTYLLVCVGSALVMMVSIEFALHKWNAQTPNLGVNINVDPARIAYGVMTGIGFLGAGVIVHNRGAVRGLTTAAGLWCIAAVGLAFGFGMYVLAILATLLILGALSILDYFEDLIPKFRHRTITIRVAYRKNCVAEIVEHFKKANLRVTDASFERTGDLKSADVHVQIAFVNRQQYYAFERQLEGMVDYQVIATRQI